MVHSTSNSIYSLSKILSRVYHSGTKQVETFDADVEYLSKKIRRTEKLRTERQKDLSLSIASGKKWSALSSNVQDFMSLTTLGAGFYSLKEEGPSVKSFLAIAAGVTAIGNRIGKETGLYDFAQKALALEENISSRLEAGMQSISSLLTFTSGVALGGLHTTVSAASEIFQGTLRAYQGSIENDFKEHTAKIQLDTAEISLNHQDIFQTGQTALRILQSQEKLSSIIKDCVEAQNIMD